MREDYLRGVIVPLVTPLASGEVDADAVSRMVEYVLDGGVHGIFVAGTTGQFALLADAQWCALVGSAVAATRGRVPVLAGIGRNTTAEAIDFARAAADLGADAVVATTPFYFRLAQIELVRHFREIAETSPLPLLLYNIPQNTGIAIEPATVAALASVPNIVGIKDSSGRFEAFRSLRRLVGPDFRVLIGTEVLIDAVALLGLDGVVPSIANLAPGLAADAWTAAKGGDWQRAGHLLARLTSLVGIYETAESGSGAGFVAALHQALIAQGVPVGHPLSPIGSIPAGGQERIAALLSETGVSRGLEEVRR